MSFRCAGCGQVVSDLFSQTCPSCGEPFDLEKAVRVDDDPEPLPPDPEVKKERIWRSLLGCGLSLVLAAAAVVVYYDLAEFERTGGTRYMPTFGIAVYRLTGKEGMLCVGLLVPVLLLYVSLGNIFGWPFCSDSDLESGDFEE